MSDHTSTTTKEIPAERWKAWCDTFTNGNRRRALSIDLVGDEVGDERLVDSLPLVAIDYDPLHKGDDFVVSYSAIIHTVYQISSIE
jgi:hypothetical protein